MAITVAAGRTGARPARQALVAISLAALGGAVAGPGAAVPVAAQEPDGQEPSALMLVVDASGSMSDPSGTGESRMAAAAAALDDVVAAVPDGTQVGLRVISGERSGEGSCEDTRLAVPPGPVDPAAVRSAVDDLDPRGDTPLADSLELAADDLPTDLPGMIVVVTDGMESCGGDPCEVAGQLVESGLDVRIDVVGFQVEQDARTQLQCVADAGNGRYVDAPDAAALAAQLQRVAVRGLRVFTPGGMPVQGTPEPPDAPAVGEGRYADELYAEEPRHYRVEVPDGATLWAAASVRPHLTDRLDDMALAVAVLGSGGSECTRERESATGAWTASLPLTTMVVAGPDDLDGCGGGPYVARVHYEPDTREPAEVRAVELLVGFEPGVTTTEGLPPKATDDAFEVELTTGSAPLEPVVGSPSMTSAPLVGPGRFSDTILVGETLIYAAELDWGQQLVCEPSLGTSAAVAEGFTGSPPVAWTRLFGPYRGRAIPTYRGETYTGEEEVTDYKASAPVRYLNREGRAPSAAAVPGTYYCAVTLEGRGGHVGLGPVPLEVAIDVAGEAGEGAPRYVPLAGTAPGSPAADQTSPAGQLGSAGSDGTPLWVWIASIALLGVLLAGGATAVAWWFRSRRTAGTDTGTGPGPAR